MKKKINALFFIVMVALCFTLPVSATTKIDGDIENSIVTPYSLYHRSASATLSISSTGLATATGKIYGIPGTTTNTTVHLYLQKYTDGAWENVDDWISRGETVSRVLTKTKQVTKGYKYRVKASCYAYKDSAYEHVTKYSSSVTY